MLSKSITQIGIRIGNVFYFLAVDLMLELFCSFLLCSLACHLITTSIYFSSIVKLPKRIRMAIEKKKKMLLLLLMSSSIGMMATTVIVQHFHEIWYSEGNKIVQIPATTASVSIWEIVAV